MAGYSGLTTLRSPDGREEAQLWLGKIQERPWWGREDKKADKKFRQLLSAGWKVIGSETPVPTEETRPEDEVAEAEEGQPGEEEKKDTSEVAEANEAGGDKHGGNHASAEVEGSPNSAQNGKKPRGQRGGKSDKNRSPASAPKKLDWCQQKGGGAVYCPQPLKVTKEMRRSAEESAQILAELVGRAAEKVRQGTDVKVMDLLVALETDDNPLPALEAPRERPRARILITPDCSGSCQSWSGVSAAWAMKIAELPDVEVVHLENSNGGLYAGGASLTDEEVVELLGSFDLLVYLGDGDGKALAHHYAESGATVIVLDCYAARVAKPRLKKRKEYASGGQLTWVDMVSATEPQTWKVALQFAIGG